MNGFGVRWRQRRNRRAPQHSIVISSRRVNHRTQKSHFSWKQRLFWRVFAQWILSELEATKSSPSSPLPPSLSEESSSFCSKSGLCSSLMKSSFNSTFLHRVEQLPPLSTLENIESSPNDIRHSQRTKDEFVMCGDLFFLSRKIEQLRCSLH